MTDPQSEISPTQPHVTLRHVITTIRLGFDQLLADWSFWCVGDIGKITQTKYKRYRELIEYDAQGIVLAKARAMVGRNEMKAFWDETGLTMTTLKGSAVLFRGHVNFHEEYGLSIIVDEISSQYTLGQRESQKRSLRDELIAKKLFDRNHDTSRGLPPFHLAIISSESSQGLHDFLAILDEKNYRYTYTPFWASIHGNDANIEVYDALKRIYRTVVSDNNPFHAVIIVRGGGGTSGISRQNDDHIVKGVCHMPIPVIVAVGHTSDTSLLDEVAKLPCKTPSDAAHALSNMYDFLIQQIITHRNDTKNSYAKTVDTRTVRVENLRTQAQQLFTQRIRLLQETLTAMMRDITSLCPQTHYAQGYLSLHNAHKEKMDAIPMVPDFPLYLFDGERWLRIDAGEVM